MWVDEVGHRYSLSEILKRFPKAGAAIPREYRPGLFFETSDELQVFFVETNRLGAESWPLGQVVSDDPSTKLIFNEAVYARHVALSEGRVNRPTSPRVKQYSEDIVQRIRSVLADYAKHSQESDRTFPERLVRFVRGEHSAVPEREILSEMAELEKKRQRLISLGLLDSESGLRDLTEEDVRRAREALRIYVGDVQEKLKVFDDIAHRIGSLMDIVNDRFKYKRLKIDRGQGFRVVSDLGQTVQLEDLSSGEQHELVVLYELLFRAPKNGLAGVY